MYIYIVKLECINMMFIICLFDEMIMLELVKINEFYFFN